MQPFLSPSCLFTKHLDNFSEKGFCKIAQINALINIQVTFQVLDWII